jgi:hypothetical protein
MDTGIDPACAFFLGMRTFLNAPDLVAPVMTVDNQAKDPLLTARQRKNGRRPGPTTRSTRGTGRPARSSSLVPSARTMISQSPVPCLRTVIGREWYISTHFEIRILGFLRNEAIVRNVDSMPISFIVR